MPKLVTYRRPYDGIDAILKFMDLPETPEAIDEFRRRYLDEQGSDTFGAGERFWANTEEAKANRISLRNRLKELWRRLGEYAPKHPGEPYNDLFFILGLVSAVYADEHKTAVIGGVEGLVAPEQRQEGLFHAGLAHLYANCWKAKTCLHCKRPFLATAPKRGICSTECQQRSRSATGLNWYRANSEQVNSKKKLERKLIAKLKELHPKTVQLLTAELSADIRKAPKSKKRGS